MVIVWPPPSVPILISISADGSLVLARDERTARLQPHGSLERWATLEAKLGVQLQVRARDAAGEGLVEKILDVILVLAATAGSKRHRGKHQ